MKQYSGIKSFLRAHVRMIRTMNCRKQFHGHWCLEHFVLKHGRAWDKTLSKFPDGIEPTQPRMCFMNAAHIALDYRWRNELLYCEGYATSLIPVPHAWVVDLQGNVIDPTWMGGSFPHTGREYYGIAFKTMYLQEALVKQERYGLIDVWWQKWPLLSAPVEDWKHPINNKSKNT